MADLFDMNAGGVGFHFTSHVIALAALFIACFAIAGYITFRNDSVPSSALKDHSHTVFGDITVDSVTTNNVITDNVSIGSLTTGSGKRSVITGYTGSEFGTITTTAPQFLVTGPDVTPSTSNRVVLPKGCFVYRVVVTATTGLTSGGEATIDLGYQSNTETPSDGDQLIAVATLDSLNAANEQIVRQFPLADASGTGPTVTVNNVLTVDVHTAALTAGALRVEVYILERL